MSHCMSTDRSHAYRIAFVFQSRNYSIFASPSLLCADLPSGYPNHTPTNSAALAATSTPDERFVEGYTFHAYSMASKIASLHARSPPGKN